MINKVIIQGNLVKEPDYREFPNGGGQVCTMRLASSRKFVNNGKTVEETTFVKVESFGKLASSCRQFLSQGSPVIFVGRLHLKQWQNKQGENRQELVIAAESMEFLPKAGERSNPPRPPRNDQSDRAQYAPPAMPDVSEEPMDDIPF